MTAAAPQPPDPLVRVVRVIEDLGLLAPDALAVSLAAWRERPPGEDTEDDASEVHGFVTSLFRAGRLNHGQVRALLDMVGRQPATGAPDDPLVGRTVGAYVVQARVGEGAYARVYRAAHSATGEDGYVLKVFAAPGDPAALARFGREGQVMATLTHPNVVRVFEAGEAEGYSYLVMEYVEGFTLQEVVERKGRFPWESATRAVRQVAAALAAAHAMGVVHRDVKPHNVLVARDGTLKLCDFGLAKTLGEDMASRAGQILGSPAYIAPEQWGDHQVDHRADLFALGVIYYLLLTGVTPFRAKTPAEYATRIQSGRFAPIEGLAPRVPVSVRHVVHQLLERDRRYRTPSAQALLHDLDRLLAGKPPDVPRLERPRGAFALVGASAFTIGSGSGADIWLDDPSIRASHAQLERTKAGRLVRLLDREGRVRVNGQRVDEVILKDGDELELGDLPPLVYREGNLGGTLGPLVQSGEHEAVGFLPDPAEPQPPVAVPGLLVAALEEAAHPLALLSCIEALDAHTAEDALTASQRRLVEAGLPAELAERAAERGRFLWRQRTDWLAERLFHATHENLGRDVEAWLSWWLEVRQRYVVQVAPAGPRPAGRLVVYRRDRDAETFELDGRESWEVGRSDGADITIHDRSVSRRHLRLDRLIARYAYQDLGSRLGTRLEGRRRDVGFLRHGDVLDLGRVHLELQLFDAAPAPSEARVRADRATFSALVEMRSPAAVEALVGLLDAPARFAECRSPAEEHGIDLEAVLRPFLDAHRVLALEALPAITRSNFRDDAGAWAAWLEERRSELPPQVDPFGA